MKEMNVNAHDVVLTLPSWFSAPKIAQLSCSPYIAVPCVETVYTHPPAVLTLLQHLLVCTMFFRQSVLIVARNLDLALDAHLTLTGAQRVQNKTFCCVRSV